MVERWETASDVEGKSNMSSDTRYKRCRQGGPLMRAKADKEKEDSRSDSPVKLASAGSSWCATTDSKLKQGRSGDSSAKVKSPASSYMPWERG